MPQKIAVGSRFIPDFIILPRPFSQRKRHRAVRIFFFYGGNNFLHPRRGVTGILSTLQHKSTEAQLIPPLTAGIYFLLREPVAFSLRIASAYAAVKTIVSAKARYLNQSPDIDVCPIILSAHPVRPVEKALSVIFPLDQEPPLVVGEVPVRRETVNQVCHSISWIRCSSRYL